MPDVRIPQIVSWVTWPEKKHSRNIHITAALPLRTLSVSLARSTPLPQTLPQLQHELEQDSTNRFHYYVPI
jgi:hypothetical protein